ncbi:unnamed protein product [Lampetra planeri]
MSCLDVMYHQSYGAHYLPAEAYKATYYNHHQQQQGAKASKAPAQAAPPHSEGTKTENGPQQNQPHHPFICPWDTPVPPRVLGVV